MRALARFGRFWVDFVIGDDWMVAVIVVCALGVTFAATRLGWNAWPVLPLAIVLALGSTVARARRR
jgi:hypothetical protein